MSPAMKRVWPASWTTEVKRLMPQSWRFRHWRARRRTKKTLATSAGWMFTGRKGKASQELLPVVSAPTPKGVRSRRRMKTLKPNIHFQLFSVKSSTSTKDMMK